MAVHSMNAPTNRMSMKEYIVRYISSNIKIANKKMNYKNSSFIMTAVSLKMSMQKFGILELFYKRHPIYAIAISKQQIFGLTS